MWDQRYSDDEYAYGTEPNDFLASVADRFRPGGRILCIAEGEGRNAVFLAGRGHEVTAIDASIEGIRKTQRLAGDRGVEVTALHADLATADLGEGWDGVVSIFGHLPPPLRRDVHARCVAALAPGGVLVLEAYTPRQLAFGTGGPPVEALLMEPEALRQELGGLSFERLEELEREVHEGQYHHGRAAVVQVIGRR